MTADKQKLPVQICEIKRLIEKGHKQSSTSEIEHCIAHSDLPGLVVDVKCTYIWIGGLEVSFYYALIEAPLKASKLGCQSSKSV